jgi:hypothetical protein
MADFPIKSTLIRCGVFVLHSCSPVQKHTCQTVVVCSHACMEQPDRLLLHILVIDHSLLGSWEHIFFWIIHSIFSFNVVRLVHLMHQMAK